MSTVSPLSEVIRGVLTQPTDGISGLVDDLLTVCRERGLQIDWRADRWRVRSFAEDWQALPDLPLRKSVFRALLARLATLCNEQRPGSCSPYGGKGEIRIGTNPATVFRVDFTNTPEEQRLVLTQDRPAKAIGGDIMPAPLANEGNPMLARLLEEVPRLRKDLPGWAEGHLLPALEKFHDDATDAQIADALRDLRDLLRKRAAIGTDTWLRDIADLGTRESAGPVRGMPSASNLPPEDAERDFITNQTPEIVKQARQLRSALKPLSAKEENLNPPRPQSNPDAK